MLHLDVEIWKNNHRSQIRYSLVSSVPKCRIVVACVKDSVIAHTHRSLASHPSTSSPALSSATTPYLLSLPVNSFINSMASFMLGKSARSACNSKLASNLSLLRAQRLHTPTTPSWLFQQLFSSPAWPRASANNFLPLRSNFSTTIRRRGAQDSQKAINSAATAPNATATAVAEGLSPVPALWERLGPLTRFFRWYGKRNAQRPYLTQFLSSLVIFCAGDLAAQYFGGEEYDYKRTLRILAISAGSSIIIFKWLVLFKIFI